MVQRLPENGDADFEIVPRQIRVSNQFVPYSDLYGSFKPCHESNMIQHLLGNGNADYETVDWSGNVEVTCVVSSRYV